MDRPLPDNQLVLVSHIKGKRTEMRIGDLRKMHPIALQDYKVLLDGKWFKASIFAPADI